MDIIRSYFKSLVWMSSPTIMRDSNINLELNADVTSDSSFTVTPFIARYVMHRTRKAQGGKSLYVILPSTFVVDTQNMVTDELFPQRRIEKKDIQLCYDWAKRNQISAREEGLFLSALKSAQEKAEKFNREEAKKLRDLQARIEDQKFEISEGADAIRLTISDNIRSLPPVRLAPKLVTPTVADSAPPPVRQVLVVDDPVVSGTSSGSPAVLSADNGSLGDEITPLQLEQPTPGRFSGLRAAFSKVATKTAPLRTAFKKVAVPALTTFGLKQVGQLAMTLTPGGFLVGAVIGAVVNVGTTVVQTGMKEGWRRESFLNKKVMTKLAFGMVAGAVGGMIGVELSDRFDTLNSAWNAVKDTGAGIMIKDAATGVKEAGSAVAAASAPAMQAASAAVRSTVQAATPTAEEVRDAADRARAAKDAARQAWIDKENAFSTAEAEKEYKKEIKFVSGGPVIMPDPASLPDTTLVQNPSSPASFADAPPSSAPAPNSPVAAPKAPVADAQTAMLDAPPVDVQSAIGDAMEGRGRLCMNIGGGELCGKDPARLAEIREQLVQHAAATTDAVVSDASVHLAGAVAAPSF